MEQLAPGWLVELSKQGAGWVLFCLACVVIWSLSKQLQACQTQGRTDAEKMTEALVRAADVNRDLIVVQRERVLAERETAAAVQMLAKQVETSDALARERAEDIRRTIREGRA